MRKYIWRYGPNAYICRMESELKRKEVHLHVTVVGRLQTLADKKGWSLKQYMEWVLMKDSSKTIKTSKSFVKD